MGRGVFLFCQEHVFNRLAELDHVVRLHLEFMSRWPDSLIARKCGLAMADEARHRADFVLEAGWPGTPTCQAAFNTFDAWLRADGHRRNPGTTADLVAATLFAVLRESVHE